MKLSEFMKILDFERMLELAYKKIGAFDADVLYIYTDFRYFGSYAALYDSRDQFCRALVAPFLAREKTIVLTTFTYTSEGQFDVLRSPTKLGAMNKWILTQPGCRRSEHPLFSYAALGSDAALVETIGKSAFGYDSVFERLYDRKTAFLHIGRQYPLVILHFTT